LIGKTLLSFEHQHNLFNHDKLICPIKITDISTHGKRIIIKLENDLMFIISLGMTGKFTTGKDKHCHVTFEFENLTIYYHDVRKLGKIDVVNVNQLPKYFTLLGVNLINHLENWITLDEWLKIFNSKVMKTRRIYDILMDQKYISGLGNYLTLDSLYLAGIDPLRCGNTITKNELDSLRIAVHEIINLSARLQGYTFSDFQRLDGKRGGYRPLCYGRKTDDVGFKVIRYKINKNRSVYYVEEVQN